MFLIPINDDLIPGPVSSSATTHPTAMVSYPSFNTGQNQYIPRILKVEETSQAGGTESRTHRHSVDAFRVSVAEEGRGGFYLHLSTTSA